MSGTFPDEIWRLAMSMLPWQDITKISLVSKRLWSICAGFLAEVMVFPSVDPHPRRYMYQNNLVGYRSDLRKAILARNRTISALCDPIQACRIKEIHVTGEIAKMVWNCKKKAFEDINDYERYKFLQELELRELASYLPQATGLRILRIESCSKSNAILCSKIPLIPALQHCKLPCSVQLSNLKHRQPSSISIDASYGYHPEAHNAVALAQELDLDKVRCLEITGETAYLADINLSNFSSLTDLIISTDYLPLQHLGGKQISLNRLVISGMQDVSLEPGLRFHRFLRKISFGTLVKLTIRETSLWQADSTPHLVFDHLETLEILEVKHAKGIYQQDFPQLRNVSFCTSRRKEVDDFLTLFVDRHSSHLQKVLIRRRLETRMLLNGSRPCLTARRYEVLSPQAVKALLACRVMEVFALDGRVYFTPEDWVTFCTEQHNSKLMQVYIAPPNALVQAEVPFKIAQETVTPFGLFPYHNNRLFFRHLLGAAWCTEAVLNKSQERRQFLCEVDPMRDFTETSQSSEDMSLDDVRRALESERTDTCVCRQGEEIYSKWYSQKRDLSSDSEDEYSTSTEDDRSGPLSNMINVIFRGQFFQYEPWEPCPRSKSNKRRKYQANK